MIRVERGRLSIAAAGALLAIAGPSTAQEPPSSGTDCAISVEHLLPESGASIALPAEDSPPPCNPAPAPPPPRPAAPDIFGSVALPVGATPLDTRWQAVRASAADVTDSPWGALVQQAQGLDPLARLQLINNWVNARIAFAEDPAADQWTSLAETVARGRGDCEDYAIAKMQLLENAGVPGGDMYLVIVTDTARHADHAVLVVRDDGGLLVLDNKTDRILQADQITDYRPIVSFSSDFAWTHGYRSADRARALGTVAPGADPR